MLAQAQRDAGDLDGRGSHRPGAPGGASGRCAHHVSAGADARGARAAPGDRRSAEAGDRPAARGNKAKPGRSRCCSARRVWRSAVEARTTTALAVYKEAIAAAPDDTAVMFQFGAALDRAGKRADAQKVFRDLIAKDPLDANALNYLGYMLAEQGTRSTKRSRSSSARSRSIPTIPRISTASAGPISSRANSISRTRRCHGRGRGCRRTRSSRITLAIFG